MALPRSQALCDIETYSLYSPTPEMHTVKWSSRNSLID